MTDYNSIYDDIIKRPGGPYFRLLTLLPKKVSVRTGVAQRETQEQEHGDDRDGGEENEEANYVQKTSRRKEQRDTDLEVALSVHPFDGCPEYEALSYSWGDPNGPKYHVRCNGHAFLALSSLHSALTVLRLPDRPRTLWVDAICINQDSDDRAREERGQQVQMMRQIYGSAKRVVVWLGYEWEDNFAPSFKADDRAERLDYGDIERFVPSLETALSLHMDTLTTDPTKLWQGQAEFDRNWGIRAKLIRDAALRLKEEWDGRPKDDPRHMSYQTMISRAINEDAPKLVRRTYEYIANLPKIQKRITTQATAGGSWRSTFWNLLCREWWSRVWIIQEVCLARQIVFYCGESSFGLDHLFLGLFLHSVFQSRQAQHSTGSITLDWTLPQIMDNRALHQHRDENSTLPGLLHLLAAFRTSDATDPRDHVYSLLGLVASEELASLTAEGLKPDYTDNNTVAKCYTDTARAIYTTSNNLHMLSLPQPAVLDIAKLESYHLPSWVPDWRAKVEGSALPRHAYELEERETSNTLFSACGPCLESHSRFQHAQSMTISGYIVDAVANVVDRSFPATADLVNVLHELEESFRNDDDKSDDDETDDNNIGSFRFAMDILARILGFGGDALAISLEWEDFTKAKDGAYLTGEDMERVVCAVRCFGYMPEGPDAALKCFQQYKKGMGWSRWVHNLMVAPSRPSFKIPFIKQSAPKERNEPSKWGKALMVMAGTNRTKMREFNALQAFSIGRKLAWTDKGYLSLVHEDTQVGDKIMLCKGSRLPLVMRAAAQPGQWTVLGGCYTHGIMHGEGWDESQCVDLDIV